MTLPKDLVPGGFILTLCAALFYVTSTFDSDPLGMALGMPATHMPRLVLAVIVVLTLIMIPQGLRSARTGAGTAPPGRM